MLRSSTDTMLMTNSLPTAQLDLWVEQHSHPRYYRNLYPILDSHRRPSSLLEMERGQNTSIRKMVKDGQNPFGAENQAPPDRE